MSTERKLQQIIDLMQRDDSVDAPADAVRWSSNLFRSRATEPRKSIIQKVAAVFQMEIAANKPVFGERSASTSQIRQMLFKAGDNAIDIRIEPKGKHFSVRGQVLGDGFAGAGIKLFNDTVELETQASDLGEFGLEAVAAGRYELSIHAGTVEITLKALEIE